MQHINKWLLNNIFGMSLFLALSGLSFQFVYMYDFMNTGGAKWISLIFNYGYANFNFFRADVFEFKFNIEENSYSSTSYLNFVFYILFLISVIVYKLSRFKESKVLKFCYSLLFLFALISILFRLYYPLLNAQPGNEMVVFSLLYFVKAVVLFYVCYLYLNSWKSQRVYIDTEKMSLPDFKAFTLKRAEWYQRLMHYLLDLFLIMSIFSIYIFDFNFRGLVSSLELAVGEHFAATIVFFVFSSFYFLVFEGFFKATPAKYLSQTSVVNLNNDPVSFSNVFGRTLCRRIPFDAFSFLGKLGWHDSLAYTTVAKHEREPSKYKVIYIVFLILLIALFLYKCIDEFRIF